MKIPFYIKLFIAFLVFAILLLGFATFSFTNFYKFNDGKKDKEDSLDILNYQERIFKNKIESYSDKIENYKQNIMDDRPFKDKTILEFKIVKLNGKEIFKIKNEDNKSKIVEDEKLENIYTKKYYKNIRILNEGEIYYDNIESKKPTILTIIKREKNNFSIIKVDIKNFFQDLFDSYSRKTLVVSENGSLVNYNYSKNMNNSNFINFYLKESKKINANDYIINEKYVSKKIYINENHYFIFFIKSTSELTKNNFYSYYESIVIIGLCLSLILSLLFSFPIARLNKVVEEKNKKLDLDIKKNYLEINENQKVIDKYVMFIRLDKNSVILDISQAFCYFLGYSKGELLGHHIKILFNNNMKKNEFLELIVQNEKENSCVQEIKAYKKDKEPCHLNLYMEGIYKNKKIYAYSLIAVDITKNKKIEELYENINNQLGQYNAIFENVNSGIALIDLEGNFIKVNKPFARFLSYKDEELLKMNCISIVSESSKLLLNKLLKAAKEIGNISNIEKIFLSKNRTFVHLELSLTLLPDKKHFLFVVNSLEDKRKLQELNQNLEIRISKEVEKSIEKDKIHQQEQIRNAKLSSIGSLAAGIAHEINTPLTYIKGNLELMQYDITDLPQSEIQDRMKEDSEKIKEGINRIANIVESMREMSQSSKEIKEKTNIYATLITSLTMAYNRSKQVSRIYLNEQLFDIDSINKNKYEFYSKVQKQRIEQVWIIIINNALDELARIEDYENRDLKIFIYENSKNLIVRFHDNAGGIKDEMKHLLFEPFMSSKDHSGMGVGLNIAKKIINEQDGSIEAYNEQNGAVFEIKLKKYEEM